jgi:hypothetical protein
LVNFSQATEREEPGDAGHAGRHHFFRERLPGAGHSQQKPAGPIVGGDRGHFGKMENFALVAARSIDPEIHFFAHDNP